MSDKTIRHLATAAVLLVAAIAATVSYQHLYHLAVTHGETRMDSALIPLSIDGTVVTASLLMLRAARLGLRTPWLARCMLALAVTMTVAANVAFGWQYAAWGVFIAGWPAAAFLLNAESSISFGRKTSPPAAVPVVAEPSAVAVQKAPAVRTRKAVRKPSDTDRAARLRALLDDGQTVTIDRAMVELKAGRPVAKRLLGLAMANGKAH